MNMLEQVGKRFTTETPKFWKKISYIGGVLTAISLGLLAVPDNVHLPEVLVDIAGYLATGGFVLTVVARATTTNNELSDQ